MSPDVAGRFVSYGELRPAGASFGVTPRGILSVRALE